MTREKKILVFGHRNPDTDSIVSAIAYAELKRAQGLANCFAARCGNLNLQTQYVLERFGEPAPEFVGELIPKVRNHMSRGAVTVPHDMPLWQALETLNKGNFKMLPIVGEGGRLDSILHFNAFAQNMLRKIDPDRKGVFPASVSLLVKTLGAQPVTVFDADAVFQAQIAVAAYEFDAFREHIEAMPLASRCLADFSLDSSILGLRPPRRPRARAAVKPAIVRSRTSSLSIWARAAIT